MLDRPIPPAFCNAPCPSPPDLRTLGMPGASWGNKHQIRTLGRNEAPGPLLLSGCTICCGHCGTRASSAASASLWAPLRLFSRLVAFSGLLVAAAPPRMEAMGAAGSGVADFALCCKARGPLFAWISQWHCNSNKPARVHLLMANAAPMACSCGRPINTRTIAWLVASVGLPQRPLSWLSFRSENSGGGLCVSNANCKHHTGVSRWICVCSNSSRGPLVRPLCLSWGLGFGCSIPQCPPVLPPFGSEMPLETI